ncbi:protein FAM161A [Limanda limanda]|uniref:protein FAM161A n=1 Tax=Limanda limanda TaxID=27771 RepID=UPI0029C78DDD|nr:protein FAM161A [Limanda limanda]
MDSHRTNVLVTSCLKTPVDPLTKAPLASYERDRDHRGHRDHRDHRGHQGHRDHRDHEAEHEDSGSDSCDDERLANGVMNDHVASGERLDLSGIFFSNEEYYSKLEELKKAHLRTMAELESMYRRKLQLKFMEPSDLTALEAGLRSLGGASSPAESHRLRRSHSAVELRRRRRSSGHLDSSDEDEEVSNEVETGRLFSPKEHIKNMWRDFKLSPNTRHVTSSSLQSLPGDQTRSGERNAKKRETWKHRVTIPKPFHMTLREAERQKLGVRSRAEVELENAELRRQLEELSECQRKFRASPVPAHVHLPLYEELQEQKDERQRNQQQLRAVQKPFSFLERERLKKEQKQLRVPPASHQDRVTPFKAKPVPRAVYAAASGGQTKDEQLYRSIRTQMRAEELLHAASMPPSMLSPRLSQRRKTPAAGGGSSFPHRPQINREVPDHDASYRRFQKHLEKRKEVKPTTTCEPFDLKTSRIPSQRQRLLLEIQKEQSSPPRTLRWPHITSGGTRTPTSSLGSSLSGSLELLPTKGTDATKKRHEAVRKVLEQRRRAGEEEQQWKEKQQQRERKLQRLVLKRAQANDPHTALSQAHPTKLHQFRKRDLQRRREYQQEVQERQQRVEGRPLLLEQAAQRNAKQAAEKRFTAAVRGCDVTEEFLCSRAAGPGSARSPSQSSDSKHSDQEDADMGFQPVRYRKVFLDDEDVDDPTERRRGTEDEDQASSNRHAGDDPGGHHGDDQHGSDDGYHYSDDHENYSDDSEGHTQRPEATE